MPIHGSVTKSFCRFNPLVEKQLHVIEEEAAAFFEQAEGHPLASLGRAELAFDRGDPQGAAEAAVRAVAERASHPGGRTGASDRWRIARAAWRRSRISA